MLLCGLHTVLALGGVQAVSHVDLLPTLLNLARLPEPVAAQPPLQADIDARWDVARLHDDVLRSSRRRRRWIQDRFSAGDHPARDDQPFVDASGRCVHGGSQSSPTMVKGPARLACVAPKPRDRPRTQPSKDPSK